MTSRPRFEKGHKGYKRRTNEEIRVEAMAALVGESISPVKKRLRREHALKALQGCGFVPAMPTAVAEFTGALILREGMGKTVTDFHVVDARGRTVKVFPAVKGDGPRERRWRAGWYSQHMNEIGDSWL